MSELRAPDPTLSAFDGVVAVYDLTLPVPVAHEADDEGLAVCEFVSVLDAPYRLDAADAAYFTVPCRECFPHAPSPGHHWSRYVMGRQADVEPYEFRSKNLAWQVPA